MSPEAWGLVQTVISLLAVATGLPAIILYLLNRKNANKRLELEEGALDVSVFAEQRIAYDALLKESRGATSAALAELATYKQERIEMQRKIDEQGKEITKIKQSASDELTRTNGNLERLRRLFERVLLRTGIQLTPEELAEFESTKPQVPRVGEGSFGEG